MKDYVNLLFSIIDKIDSWENNKIAQKHEILKYYFDDDMNIDYFLDYLEKYEVFLSKNTFKNLSNNILDF